MPAPMITKEEVNRRGWKVSAFLRMSKGRFGRTYQSLGWPDLEAVFVFNRNGTEDSRCYTWRGQTFNNGDELVAAMNSVLTGGKPPDGESDGSKDDDAGAR